MDTFELIRDKAARSVLLAEDVAQIGHTLLDTRLFDDVSGIDTRPSHSAAKVLDSGWLFFVLENFFCRRLMAQAFKRDNTFNYVPCSSESVASWSMVASGTDVSQISETIVDINGLKLIKSQQSPTVAGKSLSSRFKSFIKEMLQNIGVIALEKNGTAIVGPYNLFFGVHWSDIIRLLIKRVAHLDLRDLIHLDREGVPSVERRKRLADQIHEVLASNQKCRSFEPDDLRGLSDFIALGIPVTHLESRQSNWNSALQALNKFRLQRVVSAIGLYDATKAIFFLAAAKHQGAKLVGVQHGGYYGYSMQNSYPNMLELGCNDEYWSWGWRAFPKNLKCIASVIPVGSTYLRTMTALGKNPRDKQRTSKEVLFCPTSFPSSSIRFDLLITRSFMETSVWPDESKIIAEWHARNGLHLHTKWYDQYPSLLRREQLSHQCEVAGVESKNLDPSIPARNLMSQYQIVIWDTVGTGFFEAIAAGCFTFLTPAARYMPILKSDVGLSELFFIDKKAAGSLEDRFKRACHESREFLETYGKTSEQSLYELLVAKGALNETQSVRA